MNVIVNGKSYKAVKTDECDDKYLEYDVFNGKERIGNITRYDAEIVYSIWNNNGRLVGMHKELREAVKTIAYKYITPVIY